MKKNYCLLFILFFTTVIGYGQNFESFASGIRINNTIYNISGSQSIQLINPDPGAQFFDGVNLGTFSQNSTCAAITAGEVKTWKTATSNVCSVTLSWRAYPAGSPSGVFNTIPLAQLFECNTGTSIFNDGLGPCAANDQKWKDYGLNTNFLTGLTSGNYILEVFYSLDGSDVTTSGCETTRFISNSGQNFRASFTVSNPVTNPTVSATTICENSNLQLTANPSGGTSPYTYNWTGPNGYTSAQQNPVISAQLSHSGIYSLTITDSCGITSTIQNTASVTVEDQVVPTFDAIVPAICRNGVAPILSTSSTNGITGTWNPATVSNTATGTYTFTPNAGQCAETLSLTIFVVNNVTPTFSVPSVVCYNEPVPVLPTLSNNGIVGTWNPPTINNQAGGSYTFTPNAGQCAVPLIRTITVTTINPTFDPLPPVCEGMPSPPLPPVSNNGITGTWNPAVINNMVSGSYVFTPNPGQCAPPFTLSVTITPNTVPTFSPIAPICENSAPPTLPATSLNGITGTWNPAVVNNTATTTYVFTPNPGQCGTTQTLQIQVIPNEIPLFNPIDPFCAGDIAPLLPNTSNNGINGTWNPAFINNMATGAYTFTPDIAGPCAEPVTITVTVNQILTPTFNPVQPICSGGIAPVLPTVSNNGVSGTWNPATVSNTTTTTYTFTPNPGECAIQTTLTVTVDNNVIPAFTAPAAICEGDVAPVLPIISSNGITGTWNPATVSNTATATYTFTPDAGQCALTTQITVTVQDNINPTFTIDTQLCAGDTAPLLPNVSNNLITGTWNPAVVDNMADGTYVFTPTAGQCATVRIVNIQVNPILVPAFNPVADLCAGDSVPALPLVSNNNISGTWNPAVIDNMLSGIYTFTPNPGECATPTTLSVTVNPVMTPIFDPVAPICENGIAPVLPLTSNNGVTGTWNPATVSNTATATYTFTPDAGNTCTLNAQLTVTVNENIVPAFTIDTQICVGQTPPVLATISNDGITGTWNPATVDNVADGTYVFTPDAGQCALPAIVNIEVNPIVTPDFDPIGPLCSGNTAPVLPLVSNNGISGTWNPAVVDADNTATYTFTPNPGECGTTTTLDIIVNPTIIPVFDPVAAICAGDAAPILPLTSNNGVGGTWAPATVSNTATATYTFTPDTGNVCTLEVQLTVTVNQIVTPSFNIDTQVCIGETAPILATVSNEGITGSWNPATVDNTTGGTYVFTADANQCATGLTVHIDVSPILTPTFDFIAPICFGLPAPILPLVSNNGISGTWDPANVSNAVSGSYTFTPNPGECGIPTTIDVTVNNVVTPVFDQIAPLCEGQTAPILPSVSTNGITGTWNPQTVDNMLTGVYVFTPDTGLCADVAVMVIEVNPLSTTTFALNNTFCIGDTPPILPTTSLEGFTGTWDPAVVDPNTTNTYVFTPDAGQCGLVVSVQITAVPYFTPTFNPVAAICMGDTSPVLPLDSNEGVAGTWNPAVVDNTASGTYTFTPYPGQCANVTTLEVTVNTPVTPVFPALITICTNEAAPILPSVSENGYTGVWNPAVVDNMVTGTYTFTPDAGQCALPVTLTQTVSTSIDVAFSLPTVVCTGSAAPALPPTSDNGITGTWSPAAIDNQNNGSYTFTPDAGQCDSGPITINITVGNTIPSVFDPIGTICSGSIAPALPLTSNNGITGTWNPAAIDNQNNGSYTFTPDTGQCGLPVTIAVTVAPSVIPVFDVIPPFCSGTTPPVLPSVSNDGIPGEWNPAVVDNTASGTYTFTPIGNACYAAVSVNITVNPVVTPTFDPIGPLCAGTVAPTLPSVSTNGISGTWFPSIISNTASGTYTFTPLDGSPPVCTEQVTITVTVTPGSTIFSIPAFLCSGATAPLLPTVSDNGVHGTWSPAVVDNQHSAGYIFTPDAGECAVAVALNIIVSNAIAPTFNQIPAVCLGSTPPVLPTVSTNGITGSWNPPAINILNTGTAAYVFTPNAGQCGSSFTMNISVLPITVPVFNPVNPICEGDVAPILPAVSTNGIVGSWFPPTVNNTLSAIYAFIPAPGQCADITAMEITVNPKTLPYFDPIPAVCFGSTPPVLPLTSPNGITGSWNPPVINTAQTTLYTFTPQAGQCALATTIYVNVAPFETAVFSQMGPYCSGFAIPDLPSTSDNGIGGTWNPAIINGSGTYTFTPEGNCGPNIVMDIVVNASPEDLELTTINPQGDVATGMVRIDGVTNGTPPYEYAIDGGTYFTDNTIRNLAAGDHIVSVRDSNGCEYSESINLVSGCVLPKGFSPNNDSKNDTFTVVGCDILKLELFNRWGTKVNSFNHYNNTWNGDDDRGEQLPDGTYFYVAEMVDGTTKTGWVYLNR
ncbi:gliding motility-associated C-terminal domain-containing protein [Flavobacterium pallidum]|uniref:PKD domain-containing protein n=1 Tax=Flavobacterium pallidum TaxID=2172098 RepID=A0A2S1SGC1_9FLAO|nr:gliding motility-associated C-terminal domain-containing protein [Flavobacterium pallidum]AWI25435.1 hypothetical protein HYN49_05710 [Flavobacterium pallidum]